MGIPVWFVCKVCKDSFKKVNKFIEHKKEKHLEDFLKIRRIVFEEATLDITVMIPNAPVKYLFPESSETGCITNETSSAAENNVSLTPENVQRKSVLESEFQPINACSSQPIDDSNVPIIVNANIFADTAQHASNSHSIQPLPQLQNENSIIGGAFQNSVVSNDEFLCVSQSSVSEVDIKPDIRLTLNYESVDSNIDNPSSPGCFDDKAEIHNKDPFGDDVISPSKTTKTKQLSSKRKVLSSHKSTKRIKTIPTSSTKGKKLLKSSKASTIETSLQLQCHICSKNFNSSPLLKIHVTICELYNNKRDPCEKHNSKTEAEAETDLKSKDSTKERSYKCKICFKEFRRPSSLRSHMMKHTEDRPFKCPNPNCTKSYRRGVDLQTHTAQFPNLCKIEGKPYKCTEDSSCRRSFHTPYYLQQHILIIHRKDKT